MSRTAVFACVCGMGLVGVLEVQAARADPVDPYGPEGPIVAIQTGDSLRLVRAPPGGLVALFEDAHARVYDMAWISPTTLVTVSVAADVRVFRDGKVVRTIPFDPGWGFGSIIEDPPRTASFETLELFVMPDGHLWLAAVPEPDDEGNRPSRHHVRGLSLDRPARPLRSLPRGARGLGITPRRESRPGRGVQVDLVAGPPIEDWRPRFRQVLITCSVPFAPAARRPLPLIVTPDGPSWPPASVKWLNADPPRFRIQLEDDGSGISEWGEDFVFRDCGERLFEFRGFAEGVFAERMAATDAWQLWVAGAPRVSLPGDRLDVQPPPAR